MTPVLKTFLMTSVFVVASSALVSCSAPEAPEEPKLDFTNEQIAALLGGQNMKSLEFGDIISNKDGVEISRLALETEDGRTMSFNDLDVDITAAKDQVYAISSITALDLEGYDAAKDIRVTIKGLNVTDPDAAFLTKVQKIVGRVNNQQTFATKDLRFKNLAIDTIDILSRDDDGKAHALTIYDFNIEGAGDRVFESVSITSISSETDDISLDALNVKQLDRALIDALLSRYVSGDAASGGAEGLAFEHVSLARFETKDFAIGPVTIDVKRGKDGQFSGVKIYPSTLSIPLNENAASYFLKGVSEDVGNSIEADLALDYTANNEVGDLVHSATFDSKQLGKIELSGHFKGLTPVVEDLLMQRDFSDPDIYAKNFTMQFTDSGLLKEFLNKKITTKLAAIFLLPALLEPHDDLTDDERSEKIMNFLDNPGTVTIEMKSETFRSLDEIMDAVMDPAEEIAMKIDISAAE